MNTRQIFDSMPVGDGEGLDAWPSINHSILSPSGHVSQRTAERERAKARELLFPNGIPGPEAPRRDEKAALLRQAKELRELAGRGMKPRAYLKKAAELEAEASKL